MKFTLILKSIISTLLSLAIFTKINAEPIIPVYNSACGAFNYKVICYGGNRGNSTYEGYPDSLIRVLDLSFNKTMVELSENWQVWSTNTNGVNIQARYYHQYVSLPENKLLISGGQDSWSDDALIEDQTMVFNLESNSWSSYEGFNQPGYGNRQMSFAALAYVPGKGVALYGGEEIPVNPEWIKNPDYNVTAAMNVNRTMSIIGYASLTYLDINNPEKLWSIPDQTNIPSTFSSFQTSVYYEKNKRIYYFGGYVNTYDLYYFHDFSYTVYFDTVTNTWGNQSLGGSHVPTGRAYHSTTILPNDPDVMLLYGGENDKTLSSDFCYILNFTTFEWKQLSFPALSGGTDVLRTAHSAVLVDNSTLFFVLGISSTDVATSIPVALNIANSSNIFFLNAYGISNEESKAENNTINGGIVAVIVTGSIAGISMIVAGLLFYIKKNKTKEKDAVDDILVDWEVLDKQFTEVNVSTIRHSVYSEYHTQASEGSTIISSDNNSKTSNNLNSSGGLRTIVIPDAVIEIGPSIVVPDINVSKTVDQGPKK